MTQKKVDAALVVKREAEPPAPSHLPAEPLDPPPPEATAPAAVKTTTFDLGSDWVDVGLGPLLMMSRQAVVYVIGDAAPATPPDGDDGFRLEPRVTTHVPLASTVWAASAGMGGAVLTVAGTVK